MVNFQYMMIPMLNLNKHMHGHILPFMSSLLSDSHINFIDFNFMYIFLQTHVITS